MYTLILDFLMFSAFCFLWTWIAHLWQYLERLDFDSICFPHEAQCFLLVFLILTSLLNMSASSSLFKGNTASLNLLHLRTVHVNWGHLTYSPLSSLTQFPLSKLQHSARISDLTFLAWSASRAHMLLKNGSVSVFVRFYPR